MCIFLYALKTHFVNLTKTGDSFSPAHIYIKGRAAVLSVASLRNARVGTARAACRITRLAVLTALARVLLHDPICVRVCTRRLSASAT